jgi:uncharacterized protein (TIGR03067 family)
MSAGAATLHGTWIPIAADISGHDLDITEMRVARLIIDARGYRIVDRTERTVDAGTYEIGEPRSFRTLDLCGVEGPYAGRRLLALVELDGDRLCVCYDLESAERPSGWLAQGEQLLLSVTYARVAEVPKDS